MIGRLLLAAALALLPATGRAAPAGFTTGLLGQPAILTPAGRVASTIFLLSDSAGWDDADLATAAALVAQGAIVVGIDLPSLLANLEQQQKDCLYLVSDIESLSHQLQRAMGTVDYHFPLVAGIGAGGTLALAIAAQSPAFTIGATVAVDPGAVLPLSRPLCTGAPRQPVSGGMVYGLQPGPLPDPIAVVETPAGPADGRAHVKALQDQGFAITTIATALDPPDALAEGLTRAAALAAQAPPRLVDLPVAELPAKPALDTMAIVYSGDGGWRDLDKTLAGLFQAAGVPTVGVDSLTYFWSARTPQQSAADLARLIDTYSRHWGVHHVMLVGYSFGADVLPAMFNALPAADRAMVAQITLLGFASAADDAISVSGWLGSAPSDRPTLPDLARIDPGLVQCVYGADEHDSACPQLAGTGIELIGTTGGHHFDGNYPALAAKILAGLQDRLSRNLTAQQ